MLSRLRLLLLKSSDSVKQQYANHTQNMHVQVSSLISFLPSLSLNKTYAYTNTLGIPKKNNAEETVLVSKENKNSAEAEATDTSAYTVCNDNCDSSNHHPYAFHVSGPRKVSSLNWRDLINSSWKIEAYRRTVIACFVQAVYLLELDRQENKTEGNALAPKWWIPFKYKLSQTLYDNRDGSIYGAILEWDRTAALADFILMRPAGAPRAILVLRGTLLRSPTFRRDIEDDLRFVAWESLEGSVRFNGALETLKAIADRYGGSNVCVAGHSLGAGFALQVGKTLARQGIFVDAHLFNPPSVSLGLSLKNFGEKAGFAWKRLKSMLSSSSETPASSEVGADAHTSNIGWVPHLYVNDSDYICYYYTDPAGAEEKDNENISTENRQAAGAKLFVLSKGNQKFQEAHGLQQWWSDDLELQLALCNSKLISTQLQSLYTQTQANQQLSYKNKWHFPKFVITK